MEKLTNKKALEFVLGLDAVKENVEIYEKLAKMLEQIEKKNGKKDGKPTKTQKENEPVKVMILDALENADKPVQIKEIQGTPALEKYTPQKISALVRQLVADGFVERIEEKRVAKFKLVVDNK